MMMMMSMMMVKVKMKIISHNDGANDYNCIKSIKSSSFSSSCCRCCKLQIKFAMSSGNSTPTQVQPVLALTP